MMQSAMIRATAAAAMAYCAVASNAPARPAAAGAPHLTPDCLHWMPYAHATTG
jgi:hypothetical protein